MYSVVQQNENHHHEFYGTYQNRRNHFESDVSGCRVNGIWILGHCSYKLLGKERNDYCTDQIYPTGQGQSTFDLVDGLIPIIYGFSNKVEQR